MANEITVSLKLADALKAKTPEVTKWARHKLDADK